MDGTIVDTEPYWINTEYALVAEFGGECRRVREVAVVGEREACVGNRAIDRLRVTPVARAGRRVAVVADGEMPAQRKQARFQALRLVVGGDDER